jgi:two-component system sensor histidine kinase VicK
LNRVFANIFSNAIAHTSDGGEINTYFSLTEDNRYLLIEISDTGTGISDDDADHIFERFYKVEKARHSSQKGNGLGLSIVKEIVEYHGGKIWFKSQSGKGSSFYFTLPVQHETI